jgi:hypothetical protein
MRIQREGNEAKPLMVDLAKLATRDKTEKVWMEEIPCSIYSIVTLEHFSLFVSLDVLYYRFSYEMKSKLLYKKKRVKLDRYLFIYSFFF